MIFKLVTSTTRLYWYHWIVLLASLLLTLAAWYISSSQVQAKNAQRFEFEASQLAALVSERMSRYEDALSAGVAAIKSHNNYMNTEQWESFSNKLHLEETYPGINGIGIIFYQEPGTIDAFLQQERALRPDFKIYPAHQRQEYWPITYIEPISTNASAVGLDIAFEKNRLTAARNARDSGTTQITAPIILVQDQEKTPGFLQYVPFYRDGNPVSEAERQRLFIGHVYAPFIMSKLVEGVLEQKNRNLIFSIFDEDNQLYNEINPGNYNFDPSPQFGKQITIQMYGRPWCFNIQTALSFRDATTTFQPALILVSGITIDVMLLIIFLSLTRSREHALKIAEKSTRRLTISEAYFRLIIENSPCGMIIANEAGKIERVNPETEKMFGYQANELLGKSVNLLIPELFQEVGPDNRKAFYQRPSIQSADAGSEIYGITQSGKRIPVELGLAEFDDDGGIKTLATVMDISEQVAITDELKRSNKELSDFVYVASHDLKAPLRGIMQLTSWIEEDIAETANEETRRNLALLSNRTSRLEKLLDDLLTYSRIGKNYGDRRSVNLCDLVHNTFELLDAPPGVRLKYRGSNTEIETLAIPLEVIIRNLLGNAIKHGGKNNDEIRLSVTDLGPAYEFSVRDKGPGIAPEHHSRIFDLFTTLKPRDEVEGSGMGLSIVKKLLDNHHGSIKVNSDGSNGSCFIFTWPKTQ